MSYIYSPNQNSSARKYAPSSLGSKGEQSPSLIRAAEILGLPLSRDWQIFDSKGSLVLIHYTDEADLNTYGHLRGTVVDTERGLIVGRSFGFAPTARVAAVTPRTDGALVVTDLYGQTHLFPRDEYYIRMGFEGTLIKCIKHLGEVIRFGCKHFDPSRSHWGESPMFMDMYWNLKGPKDEELFDSTATSSPWCYTFLLVHPSLLVGSKQNVGPGYIVLLHVESLWSEEEGRAAFTPSELGQYEKEPKMGFAVSNTMPPEIKEPFIFQSPDLSVETANYHLKYGYYDPYDPRDSRLQLGEFVVVFNKLNPMINIKLLSPSFAFRENIRDNDPNLKLNFYNQISLSYLPVNRLEDLNRYAEQFPLVLPEREVILPLIYGVEPEVQGKQIMDFLKTRENREYFVWYSWLLCVPLSQQEKGALYLEELRKDREDLAPWIVDLMQSEQPLDQEVINVDAIYSLMSKARGIASHRQNSLLNYRDLLLEVVSNLLGKVNGRDLYRMITCMKNMEKNKARVEGRRAKALLNINTSNNVQLKANIPSGMQLKANIPSGMQLKANIPSGMQLKANTA